MGNPGKGCLSLAPDIAFIPPRIPDFNGLKSEVLEKCFVAGKRDELLRFVHDVPLVSLPKQAMLDLEIL